MRKKAQLFYFLLILVGFSHFCFFSCASQKAINETDYQNTVMKVNEAIMTERYDEAILLLDNVTKDTEESDLKADLFCMKAHVFTSTKEYDKATKTYKKALKIKANFIKALEGIAIAHVLRAQETKEESLSLRSRKKISDYDKKVAASYKKGLPYLEKVYHQLKENNAEKEEIRSILLKLQNVYYNLSILQTGNNKKYEKEFDRVSTLLEVYK